MKITIRQQEGRYNIMAIFVDDESWCDFHLGILGRRPNFSAANLEELQKQFTELEYAGAKRFVWKRLAMRSLHSKEIVSALEERLVSANIIHRVISEIREQGYLNDGEWVDNFVGQLIRKKQGSRAIVGKLRNKGLSQREADEAVQRLCNAENSAENIEKLLTTKYRTRDLTDRKERQKVIGSLARKGYSFDDIFKALSKV